MGCDSSEVSVGGPGVPVGVVAPTPGWGFVPKEQPYFIKPGMNKSREIEVTRGILPTDPKERKKYPIATGVLDYFPSALAEVARVSYQGNEQHNPGEPLHWARGKSTDQDDTAIRHFLERDGRDSDGTLHMAKSIWRMLAALQLKLEAEGAPIARGAREPEQEKNHGTE